MYVLVFPLTSFMEVPLSGAILGQVIISRTRGVDVGSSQRLHVFIFITKSTGDKAPYDARLFVVWFFPSRTISDSYIFLCIHDCIGSHSKPISVMNYMILILYLV